MPGSLDDIYNINKKKIRKILTGLCEDTGRWSENYRNSIQTIYVLIKQFSSDLKKAEGDDRLFQKLFDTLKVISTCLTKLNLEDTVYAFYQLSELKTETAANKLLSILYKTL